MLVSIKTIRSQGMNADISDYSLPPEVFTMVRNGRAQPNSVVRGPVLVNNSVSGAGLLADSSGLFSTTFSTAFYLFLFYNAAIHLLRSGDSDDVTRAAGAYTGNSTHRWSFARFNDYVVATNGVDVPQALQLTDLSAHGPFSALSAYPASTIAQNIFGFKNFLVTTNITKSSVRHERLVKWSHSAASGLPSSWDESDETLDAGEVVLSEGDSSIVAAVPFRNFYLLYTTDEVWAMRFVGGTFIFAFERLLSGVGALHKNAVASFGESQHIALTKNFDLILHDGNSYKSLLTHNLKKLFLSEMSVTGGMLYYSQVFNDVNNEELWICYPTDSAVACKKAIVWNYKLDQWTQHELPSLYSSYVGVANHPTFMAGTPTLVDGVPVLHISDAGTPKIAHIGTVNDIVEEVRSPFIFRLERTGLSIKGAAQDGSPIIDYDTVAMFQEFRPKFKGTPGDVVAISFGSRMTADAAVSFNSPTNYTIGSSNFLPIYLTGRLLDIRMDVADASHALSLEGYDLDVVPLSRM